jgi:hypothetical protein
VGGAVSQSASIGKPVLNFGQAQSAINADLDTSLKLKDQNTQVRFFDKLRKQKTGAQAPPSTPLKHNQYLNN